MTYLFVNLQQDSSCRLQKKICLHQNSETYFRRMQFDRPRLFQLTWLAKCLSALHVSSQTLKCLTLSRRPDFVHQRMWLSILVSDRRRRCLPLAAAAMAEPASFVCSSLTTEMTDNEISSPINLWYVTQSKRTGENDEQRVVGH